MSSSGVLLCWQEVGCEVTALSHLNLGSKGVGGMPGGACPSTQNCQAVLHLGAWWEWEAEMLEEAAIGRPLPPCLLPHMQSKFLLDLETVGLVRAVATFLNVPCVPRGFYHTEAL